MGGDPGQVLWSCAGEFRADARHGRGVFNSKTDTYEGMWAFDRKHGLGILTARDGTVYEGRFSRGASQVYSSQWLGVSCPDVDGSDNANHSLLSGLQ